MNIGILTLPLYNNYGGILQAYALKTILEQMGHNPVLLKRYSNTTKWSFYLKKLLGVVGIERYSGRRYSAITKFVQKEFQVSSCLLSHQDFQNEINKLYLEAVIVGSDQVWRKEYCLGAEMDYFLNISSAKVRRIAYAASFGVDNWDYSASETSDISRCLSSFSGISLREQTYISTLFEHTGYEAKWCLDPTLLLDSQHYKTFIKEKPIDENYTFVYWLGSQENLSKHLPKNKKIVQVRLDDSPCYAIEDWLTYIYYADNIITDSFHGCVFSLLFHKKISVFKNEKGGIGRLISLFRMFKIEDMIDNAEYHIDYFKFENLLTVYRANSIEFIRKSLES